MKPRTLVAALAAISVTACVSNGASFKNDPLTSTTYKPKTISAQLYPLETPGRHPAVVLLPHCGGLTSNVVRYWPQYLNEQGYVVLVVDFFGSRGGRDCASSPRLFSASKLEMPNDAYGARDYLATLPSVDPSKIAVMGFSVGAIAINGAMVPWRVRDGRPDDFQAAVAMYGVCFNMGSQKTPFPVLELAPEKDLSTFNSCRDAGKNVPGVETHVMAGAYHAFDSFEGSGTRDVFGIAMQYDGAVTEQAKVIVRDFLAKHLK